MYRALEMIFSTPEVLFDILIFCLCGCLGQIVMFGLIKDYGSLMWITVSVTRQLFTILLSVLIFNHSMNSLQWLGISLVFVGLGIEIFFSYRNSKTKDAVNKEE